MNLSLTTESNVLYHIKNWKEKNDVTLKQTSKQKTFWKILNQIKIQRDGMCLLTKILTKFSAKFLSYNLYILVEKRKCGNPGLLKEGEPSL